MSSTSQATTNERWIAASGSRSQSGSTPCRTADGQGLGMAARRTPEGARRLGRVLPRVRRCAALVRGVRGGGAGGVSSVRRGDAALLPRVRGALQLGVRRGVRVLRLAATKPGPLRDEDPAPLIYPLICENPITVTVSSGVTSRL